MNAVYQDPGPCPCETSNCSEWGTKLSRKTGHLVGCLCPSCQGRVNQKGGGKHQSKALRDAAAAEGKDMKVAPTHEEAARLLVHYEVKSGDQVPTASPKLLRDWEKQARDAAQLNVPMKKWAVVCVFPDGTRRIWMNFDQWLELVAEIAES